jgi:hypothetical protein
VKAIYRESSSPFLYSACLQLPFYMLNMLKRFDWTPGSIATLCAQCIRLATSIQVFYSLYPSREQLSYHTTIRNSWKLQENGSQH